MRVSENPAERHEHSLASDPAPRLVVIDPPVSDGAIAAAVELGADWVLVLAGDERLDPDDARDLEAFLATDALVGCAYGLRAHRTWADSTHDPHFEWVYCLFAAQPGQVLSDQHAPRHRVPASIPEPMWVPTTFRIQRTVDDEPPPTTATPWPRRQPQTPALPAPPVPGDAGTALSWPSAEDPPPSIRHAKVVCLLPARNCVDDLPGWFESVSSFADAVVALDDGSTDETGEQLAQHPLVAVGLHNPRRATYREWDDGANRNQLLHAAAALEPDWIISLDADERIPPDDGRALRQFIDEEARRGYAYGFNRYRMVDDLDHYDRIEQRAWRLFAFEPQARFPDRRLHFFPVPTAIPRRRWLPTSVRIQHLAGLTAQRRRARWEKFREADPDCRWEPDYEYTVAPPGERRPWHPRPPALPVMPASREAERRVELERLDLETDLEIAEPMRWSLPNTGSDATMP